MKQRIKIIMAEAFNVSANKITDNVEFGSYSKWDSLGHINLIAKLEESFNLIFEIEEMSEMMNLNKIIYTIENKLKNRQ